MGCGREEVSPMKLRQGLYHVPLKSLSQHLYFISPPLEDSVWALGPQELNDCLLFSKSCLSQPGSLLP